MLLGITGTDGSGKGTAVDYLVTHHGFVHYSARGILIDILNERDMEPTRANMRIVANEMREECGNDYIVTHNLKKIKDDGTERAIIESIRAVAEAETLKAQGGILLAVDADQALRYERVQSRRSETDKVSFEEFVAHEELEANDPNPHGMQKRKVMEMADFTIMNNGTVEELHSSIELFLKKASITQ
jgi:dephospho-CoA kinase